MALGQEFREAVSEMISDDFGSLLSYRRITRTENMVTGEVEETVTSTSFVGAVSNAQEFQSIFAQSSLTGVSTAVVIAGDALDEQPSRGDEVALGASVTSYHRISEVQEFLGANPSGDPIVVAWIVLLES